MGSDEVPVAVSLIMGDPQLEGWDAVETELVYNMQEAVNRLTERLPLLR
mgnify:CR=1 FL=1